MEVIQNRATTEAAVALIQLSSEANINDMPHQKKMRRIQATISTDGYGDRDSTFIKYVKAEEPTISNVICDAVFDGVSSCKVNFPSRVSFEPITELRKIPKVKPRSSPSRKLQTYRYCEGNQVFLDESNLSKEQRIKDLNDTVQIHIQINKKLEEKNDKLKETLKRLEREKKELEEKNEKLEKALNHLEVLNKAEISKLMEALESKNGEVTKLENKLKEDEIVLQHFKMRVDSAIYALRQPFHNSSILDRHDDMLKVETAEVNNNNSTNPNSDQAKPPSSDQSETSSASSKQKITDRQNRKWTQSENETILKYILETIRSGSKIEKPNAPKYYTKMIKESNLSPDITHNLLRNKVQNFRRSYEKALKDKTECSYHSYLEEIWGGKSCDSSSECGSLPEAF